MIIIRNMAIKRIEYIDIAKAIAIFLVILGHVINGTIYKTIIYSFHMPLFFILSGINLNVPTVGNFKSLIKRVLTKKIHTLMIPYFLWALIYSELNVKNLFYIGYGSWQTLGLAQSLSSLWFLPVLFVSFFVSYVMLFILNKLCNKTIVAHSITCVILFLLGSFMPNFEYGYLWGINIAFMGASFLCFGYIMKQFMEYLQNKNISFSFVIITLMVAILIVSIFKGSQGIGYVRMSDGRYGNIFYFLINALLGSNLIILCSNLLGRIEIQKKITIYIGCNTLGIFLVHKFIIQSSINLFTKLGFAYNNIFDAIIISLIILFACICVVYILTKLIPILVGKTIN